ncbi:MAG TPA: YraN family protein [Candidatus Limnocylindria bacterium]|nr:YraN family protein [Candidatus Limnocylindria bacterium]
MPDPRHRLGSAAEALVARWLGECGWQILARRWRVAEGELDLVALAPDGVLVGIEVRARRSRRTGHPAETVGPRRVARLRTALARYRAARPLPGVPSRIDLVTVEPAVSASAGEPDAEVWRLSRLPGIDGP